MSSDKIDGIKNKIAQDTLKLILGEGNHEYLGFFKNSTQALIVSASKKSFLKACRDGRTDIVETLLNGNLIKLNDGCANGIEQAMIEENINILNLIYEKFRQDKKKAKFVSDCIVDEISYILSENRKDEKVALLRRLHNDGVKFSQEVLRTSIGGETGSMKVTTFLLDEAKSEYKLIDLIYSCFISSNKYGIEFLRERNLICEANRDVLIKAAKGYLLYLSQLHIGNNKHVLEKASFVLDVVKPSKTEIGEHLLKLNNKDNDRDCKDQIVEILNNYQCQK